MFLPDTGESVKEQTTGIFFRGHNILLHKRLHCQAWLVLESLVKSHAYLSTLFTVMTEYHTL